MMTPELTTVRLRLRPFRIADYEAAQQGDAALADHLGAPVAAGWLEFPEALEFWRQRLLAEPALLPWSMYGYFDRQTGELLGGGGFKGAPDAAGRVELGYGLAPGARGRGLATEAAHELVRFAYAQPAVRLVLAHTLPEANASTRVLERAGFTWFADVVDPDDGPIWCWHHVGPAPTEAGTPSR